MAQARGGDVTEDDVGGAAFAHDRPPRPHRCAGADPGAYHWKRSGMDRTARGDRATLDGGGTGGGVICDSTLSSSWRKPGPITPGRNRGGRSSPPAFAKQLTVVMG